MPQVSSIHNGLTLLARLAQGHKCAIPWLEEAFDRNLEEIAETALDVAVETGDPIGQVLARKISMLSPMTFLAEKLMEWCAEEPYAESVPLREVAVESTSIVVANLRRIYPDPTIEQKARLAQLLDYWAVLLAEVGKKEEAVGVTEESLELFQTLVASQVGDHEENLARTYNNLGNRYAALGQLKAALDATEHAIEIYRRLALQNPDSYLGGVAMSVNNLSLRQHDLGQHMAALEAAEEAVAIYENLASANSAFRLLLTTAYTNYGLRLADVGRTQMAIETTGKAANLLRQMAAVRPDQYGAFLARTLNNLGNQLAEAGRLNDAIGPNTESAEMFRILAQARPEVFLREQARALNNLGSRLSAVDRIEDALSATQEAVAILRHLAESNSRVGFPELASALVNLGSDLGLVGRLGESIKVLSEAVGIYRQAIAFTEVWLPELAVGLNNLSVMLYQSGATEDALAVSREAIAIQSRLTREGQDTMLPELARSWFNLILRLGALSLKPETEEAIQQVLQVETQLAAFQIPLWLERSTIRLFTMANIADSLGLRHLAVEVQQQAVSTCRIHSTCSPDILPRLDAYQAKLGNLVSKAGLSDEGSAGPALAQASGLESAPE